MADIFRSFLDIRPLCTNYNLHLFLSPKHLSSALAHSQYSRINRIKRRPLHLTQLSKPSSPIPSSPDFDVISTHEHSDGSLIFRFGDPNEIAKEIQMEQQPKVEKKEIEREGTEEDSTVKVLDGDHEREVILTKTEREVKGPDSVELTDESSLIVTRSRTISVVETENESGEKLLEGSNEIELPIVVSNVGMKVASTPGNDIENIENAEEGLNKEHEDSCPAGASAFDKNLNRENSIVTVESPAKNTVDVTSSQSISVKPDSVIDDIENIENAEEDLNKEHEGSYPADSSAFDKNLNIESSIATVESPEKKIVDVTSLQSISVNPDTVIAVSENFIFQGSLEIDFMTEVLTNETIKDGAENGSNGLLSLSPQLEPALSLSEDAEDQNLQAVMQNVMLESCSSSDNNDIVAISPQTEAAVYLTMDAESQTSVDSIGMTNEIVIDGGESDTILLVPVSSLLEAEPVIDEELGNGTVEDCMDGDGAESCTMITSSISYL